MCSAHSNIKVNLTASSGKRTSTTVNYTIAEFYCEHVLGQDCRIGENVRDLIADEINFIIMDYELSSKEAIENFLLYKILNHKTKQDDLFL